ncbi:heparin cofactor 2 [Hyla sarda]|uniref:heparin cofactor 2 n=1 Tax=Hyla sarda TaxID=327740 RepID=UPI0024C2ECA5|nr:heparin cofactor 2 [Hyla sarda]
MGLLHLATSLLLISSALCGVKDLHEHFAKSDGASPLGARGLSPQSELSLQDETVTNDLIPEGEDDEDYIDFDKIFSEDEDYPEIIDALPEIKGDDKTQGNIYELFPGKTRIQRLNIMNAKFGFNLYRAIRENTNVTDNILMAPVGVSTAMATISMGTKGKTESEILSTLGFKEFINASTKYDKTTIHSVFRKLTHRLFRRNFGYTLRSVNDLYIRQDFPIEKDFQDKLKNYYYAEAQIGDFADKAFLHKVNQRIQKLTKGLIKEALANLDPNILMLLINCIYFKGTWENKFPLEQTYNANFRVSEKEVVKVPMMKLKGSFLFALDSELDCDVLQLPYVGNISMLLVVPHKISGMKLLEKQLSPHLIDRWQKSMTNRTREVHLPRFKLEKNYNLKDALSSMGVKELFTSKADFSGITDEDINIGLFQQQGSITVNEEGTQAGAVTVVGFTPLSIPTRFIADRPFLFLIYEHRTDCLIFFGKVANPTKS